MTDANQGQGPSVVHFEGTTKTMRKLKQGDVLAFITMADVVTFGGADFIVQFFFKT